MKSNIVSFLCIPNCHGLILHEASHVAIGADQFAMSVAPSMMPPTKTQGDVPQRKTLDELVMDYVRTLDKALLPQIEELQKEMSK